MPFVISPSSFILLPSSHNKWQKHISWKSAQLEIGSAKRQNSSPKKKASLLSGEKWHRHLIVIQVKIPISISSASFFLSHFSASPCIEFLKKAKLHFYFGSHKKESDKKTMGRFQTVHTINKHFENSTSKVSELLIKTSWLMSHATSQISEMGFICKFQFN